MCTDSLHIPLQMHQLSFSMLRCLHLSKDRHRHCRDLLMTHVEALSLLLLLPLLMLNLWLVDRVFLEFSSSAIHSCFCFSTVTLRCCRTEKMAILLSNLIAYSYRIQNLLLALSSLHLPIPEFVVIFLNLMVQLIVTVVLVFLEFSSEVISCSIEQHHCYRTK